MKNIPNISFKNQQDLSDIEIIEVSQIFERVEEYPDHNPCNPHRIDFFAILIVTKGKGIHHVDLDQYPVKLGSVVKIAKGQIHAFQNQLTYEGYLFVFTEDFLINHFSSRSQELISHLYNYHLSSPLVLHDKHGRAFLEDLRQEQANENTYIRSEILAKMLELYLLRLEQQTHNLATSTVKAGHLSLFNRFKSLVEKNYTSTRNVKDFAAKLQISAKHLNAIVHQVTHSSAKTFIDQHIVLEAKRTMLTKQMNITEVAYSLGFDELTNFTKFFKKHTSVSPKEFNARF